MVASKKIASDVVLFGLFWICIFGHWHTVNALGDDSSIYLVDFDETAYDLYLKGYYPSDYTYADFRRDSIESMTSHYVATDSNNFTAIVDTIENDVLHNGWSVIDNFFENAWLDLKSGFITVAEGFTDDFKHELDGRFKITPSSSTVTIGSGAWVPLPFTIGSYSFSYFYSDNGGSTAGWTAYATNVNGKGLICVDIGDNTNYGTTFYSVRGDGGASQRLSGGSATGSVHKGRYSTLASYGVPSGISTSQYSTLNAAVNDFYNNAIVGNSGEPYWNGDGYYSDTPTNYNINLPALPSINWPSISTNNKTKYGIDFPDVDLTIDFQLPDSYYPQTVTYDTPYWLYNTDSTPVDWANVSFEDVTLPEVQLTDGDGSFFQALFNTLPLAFVSIFLGVILCYLIFLML